MSDPPRKLVGIVEEVDQCDVDDVSGWAYEFCRSTPADVIVATHDLAGSSDDDLADAVTRRLPPITRDAARAACKRGLAEQRRSVAPTPTSAATPRPATQEER
jgi:hypothetical protein